MLAKVKKILIYSALTIGSGFIVLLTIGFLAEDLPSPEPPSEALPPKLSSKEVKETIPVIKSVEPSLPSSSEPVIVSVQFSKQVPLNQKSTVTVNFKDREGDVAKLVLHDLDSGATSELDFSSKAVGKYSGSLTFIRTSKEALIRVQRLILVDAAGNQSAPYILTYQAGDTDAYYNRSAAEVLMARPVERRKKIHFFIFSNTAIKTELENGSSFTSDADSIGTISPAVVKMLEASVLPQINGLWDQCGVAFDLGMVKAVRPEKVNLPDGGTLASLFGTLFETGEPFIITDDTSGEPRGISLIKTALPAFGIPNGDIAIFIVGPKFLDIDTESENVAGHAIKNLALITWRYIHFQNETRGEIIIPKNIMKILAHELGHTLGLHHPDKEKAISEDKFSEFNLMRQGKLRSELIPEQCGIVAGQF